MKKCVVIFSLVALIPTIQAQEFSEWSTPVNLGPLINSDGNDMHPALSRDGLSMYFSSDRPGGCGGLDLYVAQRASLDAPWEPPINLGCSLNTPVSDHAPNLSTDGHSLFFHSFRAGGCGGGDVYMAHRKNRRDDFGWEAPVNINRLGRDPEEPLMCEAVGDLNFINTPNTDSGPAYFQDENGVTMMYFCRSDQPTAVGDFDVYTTTLGADGIWGSVVRDTALSTTPYRDTRTAIRRRDGLEIILSTERPGGLGDSRDLWYAMRSSTAEPWSVPLLLPNVNSLKLDGGPALSWDGTELYFFSGRDGGFGGNDLYVSTRTKNTVQQ